MILHARDCVKLYLFYAEKYFSSPDLMFPVQVNSRGGLKPKDLVFGITQTEASKASELNQQP